MLIEKNKCLFKSDILSLFETFFFANEMSPSFKFVIYNNCFSSSFFSAHCKYSEPGNSNNYGFFRFSGRKMHLFQFFTKKAKKAKS